MSISNCKPYFKLNPKNATTATIKQQQHQAPYFTIRQLAEIYEFPPVDLTISSVVGVISFGGGLYGVPPNYKKPYTIPPNTANCDVQNCWNDMEYDLSQHPKVIVCPVGDAVNDLSTPDPDGSLPNSGTCENTMDVSVIGGCCPNPNLTIILYIFPPTYSFTEALPIALKGITDPDNPSIKYIPSILSISWGLCELEYLTNGQDTYGELTNVNSILEIATQKGVNICVASGDNGSTDGHYTNQLAVDFPGSCPYVTCVGGTSLKCPNNKYDAYTQEVVWNNGPANSVANFASTGGGKSAFHARPSYQTKFVSTHNNRNTPDIALNSDPQTGIYLYIGGEMQKGYGGTSMAAPMFAAFLALFNPQIFVNPLLYSAPSTCFHDITLGNNHNTNITVADAVSFADIGYDRCSGLGSIVGTELIKWISPASAPAPAPAPASAIKKNNNKKNNKNNNKKKMIIYYTKIKSPIKNNMHSVIHKI